MTTAPTNLLAVRRLLLDNLGSHGLASAEVGVVGDTAHQQQGDSYHLGRPEQRSTGYSVSESARDRAGLTLDAAALDVGLFSVTVGGRTHNLPSFSTWLVAECMANAPDTRDIREVIYSPDGRTVKRWDRLGKRSTGDSSHLFHTHISFFRDAIKAGRDQTPLFHRYLTTIGHQEDPMDLTPQNLSDIAVAVAKGDTTPWSATANYTMGGAISDTAGRVNDLLRRLANMEAMLTALSGKDFTDEPAIIQGVLAGLTPEKIAAAIPPTIAKQVADELARRLAG
ncbi:hypothetical protein JNW88_12270 [Micromonospora sp. ATA32]|nr:hypothetical protein [Micromonospora sp. ATA32]